VVDRNRALAVGGVLGLTLAAGLAAAFLRPRRKKSPATADL